MNIMRFTVTFDFDNPSEWTVEGIPENRFKEFSHRFGEILSRMLYDVMSLRSKKHIWPEDEDDEDELPPDPPPCDRHDADGRPCIYPASHPGPHQYQRDTEKTALPPPWEWHTDRDGFPAARLKGDGFTIWVHQSIDPPDGSIAASIRLEPGATMTREANRR